jgi:hypothetical protein
MTVMGRTSSSAEHWAPAAPGNEAEAVDRAFARFTAPAGWRALRTEGRLEARWSSATGRWARFSVAVEGAGRAAPDGTLVLRRPVGAGQLTIRFDSSDLQAETVDAARALLTRLDDAIPASGRSTR